MSVHTFVGRNVPMMSDVFCVGCGPPGGGGGGTTTGPAIEFVDGRTVLQQGHGLESSLIFILLYDGR